MVDISLVTACYKSEDYIHDFYHKHKSLLESRNLSYEFIFVNDGSPDNSKDKILELVNNEKSVKFLDLTRNFGQHAAMFAGLNQAQGKLVYAADCDLEENPENILKMLDILEKDSSIDVVYGILEYRTQGFLSNIFATLFYIFFNLISDCPIPKGSVWQRIMKLKYVKDLLKHQEVETLPAGLMALTGYNQVPMKLEKKYKGSSSYTFYKKLKLATNSLVSFSSRPLIFIGLLGLAITFFSFIGMIYLIYYYYFVEAFNTGWASVIVSIYSMGGLILSGIGIVGIYLAKVFNQTKNRPLYIIKEIHSSK